MYNAHFALQGTPFRNTPDTAQFFPGSNRGAILQALTFAIDHGEGLITVIGEVGSGKTMLCRMLARAVAPEVQLIYLPNPMLSPEQAIRAIVGELGMLSPSNERTQTLECVESGTVLSVSYSQVEELYVQNPEFGFYFLRLASARL